MAYINGDPVDDSDDLIDDAALYFLFVRLAANYSTMHNGAGRDAYLAEIMKDYQEPVPGAKERVEKVLRIMLTAWAAALLRHQAEDMVKQLAM